jgi:MATE family multidrug resistance protein
MAVAESLNSALETLVPQAFGAGNLTLCGVYLNGGRLLITVVIIPIFIAIQFLDKFYISLGQDEQVVSIMKIYINYCLLGVFFYCFCDLQRRFLNSLGKNFLVMNCFTIGILLHFVWVTLFTEVFELTYEGLGYAQTLSNFLILCALIIFTYRENDISEAIFLPDKRSFMTIKA